MYIEELYRMIDTLDLSEQEAFQMRQVVKNAAYIYLTELDNTEDKEQIKFTLSDMAIEQNAILSELGIKVKPQVGTIVDTWNNNVKLSEERKTEVSFPTRLFSKETKEEVNKKVYKYTK